MAQRLPAYQVKELEGTRTKTVYKWDKKAKQIAPVETEVEAGYMVYFPRGHSIRVETPAELARLGFTRPAHSVVEDGDAEIDEPGGPDLQELNRRMTRERAVELDVAE